MSAEKVEAELVRTEPRDATATAAAPVSEEVVFVLRYDEELTFLVNEGVVRPGLLPSGLK